MKLLVFFYFLSLIFFTQIINAQSVYTKANLSQEYEIIEKALFSLHPGLHRYKNEKEIQQYFKNAKNKYIESKNLKEAFLNLSEIMIGLQCGHTYPNYWNQNQSIQSELFDGTDKLPFTHVITENSILIHKNLSYQDIPDGSKLVSINGVSSQEIIQNLFKYMRSDGDNDLKKYKELSVSGIGKYEAFDIFFPLLYPTESQKFDIVIETPNGNQNTLTVQAFSRFDRTRRLEEKYGVSASNKDDLWSYKKIDDKTTLLQLGTFAVWNMKMDWQVYLSDFFEQLNTEALIIDLRGNEGGLMEVYWRLLSYLTDEPLELMRDEQLLRYQTVEEGLRPLLSSWDDNLFDRGETVIPKNDNFFRFKDLSIDTLKIEPSLTAFTGKTIFLIDAANSSATYYLSKFVRENSLGTLVGQTTGGNLMGTNGGQMFMLRLPKTGLEIDLPLIGYYPKQSQENKGLTPDYEVKRDINYYHSKEDLDIKKALEIINK